MSQIQTLGIDHVGLTVPSLDQTKAFFLDCLSWSLRGGVPSIYQGRRLAGRQRAIRP